MPAFRELIGPTRDLEQRIEECPTWHKPGRGWRPRSKWASEINAAKSGQKPDAGVARLGHAATEDADERSKVRAAEGAASAASDRAKQDARVSEERSKVRAAAEEARSAASAMAASDRAKQDASVSEALVRDGGVYRDSDGDYLAVVDGRVFPLESADAKTIHPVKDQSETLTEWWLNERDGPSGNPEYEISVEVGAVSADLKASLRQSLPPRIRFAEGVRVRVIEGRYAGEEGVIVDGREASAGWTFKMLLVNGITIPNGTSRMRSKSVERAMIA